MYASFNKILKQKESVKVPEEIIKQLNKNLPKGLEYIQIGENACGITSKEDLNIALNILLPNIPVKYMEIIKTSDDLFEYLYRTQTKLTCKPNEDGTITINNSRIAISDFIKFPLSDNYFKSFGEFYIIPQEFPEIGNMVFQTGQIKKNLNIQRVPFDSMDTVAFESQDDTWIKVRILINEKTHLTNISFTFKLESIKSVNEFIEALKFHNNLYTEGIFMAGFKLDGKISRDKIISSDSIAFWERVLKLEEILGLHFDCSIPITRNDAYNFHILFRSFIEDMSYREDIEVGSETELYFSNIDNIKEDIGKEMALNYFQEFQWELQGQKFSTYAITVLFNVIVDSIGEEDTNEGSRFFAKLKSPENKIMYQVIKQFISRNKAEDFQSNMNKNFSYYADIMRVTEKIII